MRPFNLRRSLSVISLLGLPFVVNAGACSSDPAREEGEEAIAPAQLKLTASFAPCPDTTPVVHCGSITVPADASCHGFGALPISQTCNLMGPLTCLQGLQAGDVPSIPQSAPPGPYPLGKTTAVPVTCTASGVQASCKESVTVVDVTSPVLTCPGAQVLTCGTMLATGTAATATDNCGVAPPTCDHALDLPFPDGTTTVTCTAVDTSGNASSCSFDVTVAPDTTAPAISCPGDQDLGCTGTATMPSATDSCGGPAAVQCSSSALSSTVMAYSCTATDGAGNVSPACSFKATKGSQSPPAIVVEIPMVELWPPNHKYAFNLGACGISTVDSCGVSSPVDSTNAHIDRITSDEPEDANGNGDGHTCNDIVLGSDGFSATLRAERDGGAGHNGRVYTVWFTAGGASASCQVGVPHDQSPPVAVDDGICRYCVAKVDADCGSCPRHDPSCNY
jgi:hypothetical protein